MKCWMSTLSLVLLFVAVATARRRPGGHGGGGGHGGPPNGDHRACMTALKPSDTEIEAMKDATTLCIAEQDGLEDIIATLTGNCRNDNPGGGKPRRRGPPKGPPHHCDVANRLDKAGHTTEATTLRECLARETDLLNTDGTFNDEALQTQIKAMVSGATIEENTLLGITNCGTVEDYNIHDYMRCIKSYCATGSYSPPA